MVFLKSRLSYEHGLSSYVLPPCKQRPHFSITHESRRYLAKGSKSWLEKFCRPSWAR